MSEDEVEAALALLEQRSEEAAASGALATPAGFAAFIAEDLARSRDVARTADIRVE